MTKINTYGGAAATVADDGLFFWGDSFTQSTSGGILLPDQFPVMVAKTLTPRRTAYNGGVGGETAAQIAARQLVYPCRDAINVFWAGRNGVLSLSAASIVASIQSMADYLTHDRFVVLSILAYADGTEPPASADRNLIVACNAALAAAFPDNFVDFFDELDDNALRGDGLHLNAAGIAIAADAVADFIATKGW